MSQDQQHAILSVAFSFTTTYAPGRIMNRVRRG